MTWNEPYEPSKCTIVASVDAKTGTVIYFAMAGASRIKNGGISNLMETLSCKLAYTTWLQGHGGRSDKKHATAIKNNSTAIVFAIGHWPISLL
jgi:hypothetical protein